MADSSYNFTDPTVVFDPNYDKSVVVKAWQPANDEDKTDKPETQDELKIDGIKRPIIRLNNKVLDSSQIVEFTLYQNNFVPTLDLTISDNNKIIQNTDTPGLNNSVTIILTAPVNGSNKKIKLDFFITEVLVENGNLLTYKCNYKYMDLHKVQWKQIGSGKISTYEMLKNIAQECKLGFAATQKSDNINDKRYRQIYSKKYIDFIKEQLEINGEDEDNLLDAWIDLFGYLVVVNLPQTFKADVDTSKLTTKVILGTNNTDGNMTQQTVKEVPRLLTNERAGVGPNNMHIDTYEPIVWNDVIQDNGSLKTYYTLSSLGDKNIIGQQQIQIIENSIDGAKNPDEYEFQTSEFLGIDFTEDGDVPISFQKEVVKNYLIKLRSKQLSVNLSVPNYSLQRGMLVNVCINVYEPSLKRTILANSDNVTDPLNESIDIDTEDADEKANVISSESIGIPNPSLSGLYYIDTESFYYESGSDNIIQTLNLIKKGPTTNIFNLSNTPKVQSK